MGVVWYEILRFLARPDENYEWQYEAEPMMWRFVRLGAWSVPHDARRVVATFLWVTKESLRDTHDDLTFLYLQEANKRALENHSRYSYAL